MANTFYVITWLLLVSTIVVDATGVIGTFLYGGDSMRVGEWISDSSTSATVSLGLFNNGLLCLQANGSPSAQSKSVWCSTNTIASNTTSNGGYSLALNKDGTLCVKLSQNGTTATIWCNTQYANIVPNQQFMIGIDSDKIGISVTSFMGIFWSSPRPYTPPRSVYKGHDLESRDRCSANVLQGWPKQVWGSDYCGFSIQDPPVNGIQFISTSPSINNGSIPSVKTTLYCPARNNDTTYAFSPSPGDTFYILCQTYSQVTQDRSTGLYTVNPTTITPCPGVMQIPFYTTAPYPGPGISITYPTYSYPGYVWVNITVDAEVLNANATTSYFNSVYHDRVFSARSYKLLNSGCECRQATPGQLERTGTGPLCQQECSFFTEFRTQNKANTYSPFVSGSNPDVGYYCSANASLISYPGNTYTRTTQNYGSGSCPSCTQFIYYQSQQDVCGKYYTGSSIMPRSFHYLSPINHQVCLSLLPVQIVTIALTSGYSVSSLQCEWPTDWIPTGNVRSLVITSSNGYTQTLRCFTFNLQQNSMFFQTVNLQKNPTNNGATAYGTYIGATGIDSVVTCTDTTSCGSQCATTCPVLVNIYDYLSHDPGIEPLPICTGVSDCNRAYCDLNTCKSQCQNPLIAAYTETTPGYLPLVYCAPTACPPSMYGSFCADACPNCDHLLRGSVCNDGKTGDGTCHCPTGLVLDGDGAACVDPSSLCSTSINHLYGPSPFDTSCVPAPGVAVDHGAYVLIIPYLTTQFPVVSLTYTCDVPIPLQYVPTYDSVGGLFINTRTLLCSSVSYQQYVIPTVDVSTIQRFTFEYHPPSGSTIDTTVPPVLLDQMKPLNTTQFTTFCNGHGKVKLHTRMHIKEEFFGYTASDFKLYKYIPTTLATTAFNMQGNISSYGMYLFYNNMNPNAVQSDIFYKATYPEDYPDTTSTCYCDSGWWGASCNTTCAAYIPGIQFCDPHNITNIICSEYATYNPTYGFCVAKTCPLDRAGQQCHLQCPLCSSDQYCKNGLNGDGRCYCSDPRLQIDPVSRTCVPDLCGPVDNLCFGHGVCTTSTTTQFKYCVCTTGFEPPFCQHPVYNAIAPLQPCNCGQKWNPYTGFNGKVLCTDPSNCPGGIYPMIIQDRGWLPSVIAEIAIATSVSGFLYDTRNASVTVTTGNGLFVPLGAGSDQYSNLKYMCATTFGCTGFVVYQPPSQANYIAVFTTDQSSLRAVSTTIVTIGVTNTTVGTNIPQPPSSGSTYFTLTWYQDKNCTSPTLDVAYYYFDSGLQSVIDATYCNDVTPNSMYNGVCYLVDLYDVNAAREIGTSSCFRFNAHTGSYTLNTVCSGLSSDVARQYTDMPWAVRARAHWQTEGFIEGRNPNANCRLQPTFMSPQSNCASYTVGCEKGCTGHGFCSYANQTNPSLGAQCDCYGIASNHIWSQTSQGSLYSGQYCDATTLTCVKPCPTPQQQGVVCDTSYCSGVGQCTYFAAGADAAFAIDRCICPVGRSGTWCETIATGCNNACTIQDSVAQPKTIDDTSKCDNTATDGIVACKCGPVSFGDYCQHDAINCMNPLQQNVICSGPTRGICIAGLVDASTTACQCLTTSVTASAQNVISNVPYQGKYCQYEPCALIYGHGTCTLNFDGTSTVTCYPVYNTQSNGCRDSQCSAGVLNNTACACPASSSSTSPPPYYLTMSGKSGPLSVCFRPCSVDFNGVQCGAYTGQVVTNPVSTQNKCVPKNWDASIESVCQCATGYCLTNDVCTPYCLNGGTLQGVWDSSYCTSAFPPICTCPQYYSGSQCAIYNPPTPTTRPPTTRPPTTSTTTVAPTTSVPTTTQSVTTTHPTATVSPPTASATTIPPTTQVSTVTTHPVTTTPTTTSVIVNTNNSTSSQSTVTTLPVVIGITVGGVVALSAVVYIVVHFVLRGSILGFTQLIAAKATAAPVIAATAH